MNDSKWCFEKQRFWCLKMILLTVAVPKTTNFRNKIQAVSTPKEQLFGERHSLTKEYGGCNYFRAFNSTFHTNITATVAYNGFTGL